jgi:hypothetical protein
MKLASVYTPGAGHSPQVLAGRDELLIQWRRMLADITAHGRSRSRDMILVGQRGIGKTAAMSACVAIAARRGFEVVSLQAMAGRSGLFDSLFSRIRAKAQTANSPWARARADIERLTGVDLGAGPGHFPDGRDLATTIDPENLAEALAVVQREVRRERPSGGLLITVDEFQAASDADLVLMSAVLHRLNVDYSSAVVAFIATSRPKIFDVLLNAGVTHPNRLFTKVTLASSLEIEDAVFAVTEPARRVGVSWEPEAALHLVRSISCNPAHLQYLADAVWESAPGPDCITAADVNHVLPTAMRRMPF